MQALTNKAQAVNRAPMSFWERLYLINIIKGIFLKMIVVCAFLFCSVLFCFVFIFQIEFLDHNKNIHVLFGFPLWYEDYEKKKFFSFLFRIDKENYVLNLRLHLFF